MSAKSPRRSLAQRLSLNLLGWIGALWVAAALGTAWYTRGEVNEVFDSALVESAWRLLDLVAHEMSEEGYELTPGKAVGANALAELARMPSRQVKVEHDYLMYQVVNAEGELLMRSDDAPATVLRRSVGTGFSQDAQWRIYTLAHPVMPVYIHVADPLQHRQEAQWDITLGLLLPLTALLPLLALLIDRITRRELRSVQQLAADIQQRGGQNLQPLAVHALPRELAVIGDSTNHLLLSLSEALDTERALAANAAHELRTPLATTRLRLQAVLDHELPSTTRSELQAALDALTRLGRRTEKLLQLSRAESGAALARTCINLAEVAASVAQEFWADPSLQQRLQLQLPEDDDAWVLGDLDALAIAARNLVENAVRYAPEGPITLAVQLPATLLVRDQGPGLTAEQQATLQQRHQRSAAQALASPGYGLGLSIVHTIAARQGGQVVLVSPPPGQAQGLEVRLLLQTVTTI